MGFTWRDSFSINWDYGLAPARMYVHVSGDANVRARGGTLEIKDAGGDIDRAANGADYVLADSYVRVKVTEFDPNETLRLRLRSNGAAYALATVQLTTGAWTLGNAGGSTGSGTIDGDAPAVNDVYRLEVAGSTLTLRRQAGGVGDFVAIGSADATLAATGRAGVGVEGSASDLVKLDDFECGPLVAYTPKRLGTPTTRVVALDSSFHPERGDEQGQVHDTLWDEGPEAWLLAEVDPKYARGYRRLFSRGVGGNNTDGSIVGVNDAAANTVANMFFARHSDILLDVSRSGFSTPMDDGRLNDNLLTAWAPRVAQWDEVIWYAGPPPQGITGVAWPTDDAALDEFVQEPRQLGCSLGFDTPGAIAPAHANSSVCRAFFDRLRRTRRPGERFYTEGHAPFVAAYAPWFTPPYTAGASQIGPVDGCLSNDDLSGTSVFEKITRTELASWYGPWRLAGHEHFAVLDGSIAVGARFARACQHLVAGHSVILEVAGLSVAQDTEIQRLGRIPRPSRGGGRRGARF